LHEYIVVVEIPKLDIPYTKSLKINNHKKSFYIYPHKFLKTLKFCNKGISKLLNDSNYEQRKFLGSKSFIKKELKSYTYIITKIKLDLNLESDKISSEIRKHFNPLLNIFSLFLTEIFDINVVYIFQKQKNLYKFIQMIESPNFNKDLSKESGLRDFLYWDEVENHFSWLLIRILKRKKYLEYVDEFLTGKIKSYHLGIKLLNYWNTLGHIANRYWSDKEKNKILKSEVVKKINKKILDCIKKIKSDDIIFPGFNIKKILEKNLLLCNNKPPIRDKILTMCSKIYIKLSEEDNNIIRMIHHLRNQLDHSEYYLSNLIHGFLERFNLQKFKLKDLIYIVIKFSLIVQKILLRMLKIIPNYYILNVKNEYNHTLTPRVFKLPSKLEKEEKRKAYLEERYDTKGLSEREISLKHLRYDKIELLHRGKYTPLLKFIKRLKKIYINLTYSNFFSSTIIGKDFELPVKAKFEDDLNFTFKTTSSPDKLTLRRLSGEELNFKMKGIEKFDNYGVEFKPLIKEVSQTRLAGKLNEVKATGLGFTLRRSLKNVIKN